MNKFVHTIIPDGTSLLEYTVAPGEKLSLFLSGYSGFDTTVSVTLAGKGSSATITAVIVGTGTMHQALHTRQIHDHPGTASDLLVKTVESDHAVFLYEGSIRVARGAQKTDAYQKNENILLSDHVSVSSKPFLEILANDVRCTHSASLHHISDQQVWYLMSRGISEADARTLIIQGFIQSACDRLTDKNAKRSIMSLWQRISK